MPDDPRRVALVTGANRGIGLEIARQLGRRGITVVVGARDAGKGVGARQQLIGDGCDAHFVLLDVTAAHTVQAAATRVAEAFGRLDILVNNAGIQIDADASLLELTPHRLLDTLRTNALGPLLLCQACVPVMRARRYGRIVNMASKLGSLADIADPRSPRAAVGSPAYRLSKTLLNGITLLLARELEGANILVNSACPGWVRTDLGGNRAPLSVEEGADTPVWLATLPDGGPTGGFFRERKPIPW